MRTRSTLFVSIAVLASGLVACGAVEDHTDAPPAPIDAATIDTQDQPIDAPAADIDAAMTAVDAGTDAPACAWVRIAMCDTGGTIAQFCPSGSRVNQLRRCDGTTYTPDQQYQQYRLCNCTFQTCGCVGVAWQEVECCSL